MKVNIIKKFLKSQIECFRKSSHMPDTSVSDVNHEFSIFKQYSKKGLSAIKKGSR